MARALRIEYDRAFYMEKDRKENEKMDLLISETEKMCNVKI